MENQDLSNEEGEEMGTALLAKRRCCFCLPCLGAPERWQRIRTAEHDGEERWWARGVNALKKIREWSEIVAGPKWKTFIRRFNKNKGFCGGASVSMCAGGGGGSGKQGKFQYDPHSYALNFDDSAVENGGAEEDYAFRNFSARYASINISTKGNTDPEHEKAQALFAS